MKNKKLIFGLLTLMLVTVFAISGCKESDPDAEYTEGYITFDDVTGIDRVYVLYTSTAVTTLAEVAEAIIASVADKDSITGKVVKVLGRLKDQNYAILYITDGYENWYKETVPFSGGKATVTKGASGGFVEIDE